MKKVLSLLVALTLGLMMVGCGEDTITIAVSIPGATHGWPVGVVYHAENEVKAVAEENGWEYTLVTADTAAEQANQIDTLISEGVDAIVMLPFDGASLKAAAQDIMDNDIYLVIFDREVPDFTPDVTVKGDNYGIGEETAKIFNATFPDGTHVLEFMGDTSTVPTQRTAGYDDTINANFTKERVGFTGWQRDEARSLFENWVDSSSQAEIDAVQAIYTHDDPLALGILDALDAYALDSTFTKTFDNLQVIASSAGAQLMYNRMVTEDTYDLFSMTYSPGMIKDAIRACEKLLLGQTVETYIVLPTVEVNPSNVADYLDADSPF
ncbi:MAG: substrate-binding domain-containing protein [Acholeplasmataceae bacterium]|nr:substrate-binding domain-containing protein [Acholeplasmataceae bacterium]